MSSLSNTINKLDLFGKFYIFEEKEHHKFSTLGGITLTFIIVTTCIVMGFLFGNEIYERKKPIVNNSYERVDISRINFTDYPVFFLFSNGASANQPLGKKYIDVSMTHTQYDENLKSSVETYTGYKGCNPNDYSDTYREIFPEILHKSSQIYEVFCINYNDGLYFQNDFLSVNSAYINFNLNLKQGNFTEEELKEREGIINKIYFTVTYIDSFIDSSNYSNPVNYYQVSNGIKLNYGFRQRHKLYIENTLFITNQGWIFEDSVNQEIMKVFALEKETTTSPQNLFTLTFISKNIRTKIIRSYIKIQDTLANVGGFFNALYIISILVSKNYVDYCYYSYIYNHFSKKKIGDKEYVNKTLDSPNFKSKATIDKVMKKIVNSSISKENHNRSKCSNIENAQIANNANNANNKKIISIKNINNEDKEDKISEIKLTHLNKNITDSAMNPNLVEKNVSNSNYKFINNYTNDSNFNKLNIVKNRLNTNSNANYNINTNDIKNYPIKEINTLKNNNQSIIKHVNDLDNASIIDKYIKNRSYISYIFNDIICCSNVFSLQRKAVSHVISFDNIMEISYKNFIKTGNFDEVKNDYDSE